MMKLLTVDDSMMVRKIICEAAHVLGIEPLQAKDAQEALLVLEKHATEISVIVLDWNMPGMSGFELLQLLKASPNYSKIPVIMVTTESHKTSIINAIKAGAATYLTKPFALQDLTTRIMQCLGM